MTDADLNAIRAGDRIIVTVAPTVQRLWPVTSAGATYRNRNEAGAECLVRTIHVDPGDGFGPCGMALWCGTDTILVPQRRATISRPRCVRTVQA